MAKVTIYSRNNCMQCKMTKRFLTEHHVDFIEHNINESPQYVDYLKDRGFQSLPVIETADTQFSGFRPDKLQQLAI
ncbi:glutaredoxin [Secundilactobacillus pentosiphilus]|uniref:Glutaredoxin-like protein NrdH n=1 Tax=Secundilactobacillus pentosiphilus TaxID=1714682 RepID=A0A1Z5IXI1_9LACO|nr:MULTISPECIES: glutaredoxin-like protein NrdH [Secundilactobacillus]GAX03249.1 glutaredoxin [Secundilactobacillus pentosiphilus]GAX06475.1 glutaredoxin [Secundilactobacillus pentosiphilus]